MLKTSGSLDLIAFDAHSQRSLDRIDRDHKSVISVP